MKVVIVDDAPEVVESVQLCLSIRWPECVTFTTPRATDAVELVLKEAPDLVILDLALIGGYGLDVLRDLRRTSDVPVLIVSVKADELTRVKGLELGADDYIVKPFSHTELLARVRAVLRRSHMPELWRDEGVLKVDGISIDLAAGRVYVNNREVMLSANEWKLLSYLCKNAGRVLPMQAIASNVWGLNYVENSTIKMCVRRLRMKIGDETTAPRIIRSHRGRGYSFEIK